MDIEVEIHSWHYCVEAISAAIAKNNESENNKLTKWSIVGHLRFLAVIYPQLYGDLIISESISNVFISKIEGELEKDVLIIKFK